MLTRMYCPMQAEERQPEDEAKDFGSQREQPAAKSISSVSLAYCLITIELK